MNNLFLKILTFITIFLSSLSLYSFTHYDAGKGLSSSHYGILFASSQQTFYSKVDKIIGISMQEYVIDDYKVIEVVIDIDSSTNQLRIYAKEPMNSGAMLNGDKSVDEIDFLNTSTLGEDINDESQSASVGPLIKEYPATTHSKTLEYKVDAGELKEFYRAIRIHLGLIPGTGGSISNRRYEFHLEG